MNFRVVIVPRARRDVSQNFRWMAERSPDGANRWLAAFETALERLELNPRFYGLASENELVDDEIREFLFKTPQGRVFRRVFCNLANDVHVLHVRSSDRGPLTADDLT